MFSLKIAWQLSATDLWLTQLEKMLTTGCGSCDHNRMIHRISKSTTTAQQKLPHAIIYSISIKAR